MKKILILLLLIFFMPNNAQAFGPNKTMEAIMSSWVGKNIDSVIDHWGYPTNERRMAGRTLYYWDWSYNMNSPAYTNAQAYTSGNTTSINAMTYGGGTINVSCNRILEVDSDGTVVSWQWSGNNCPYTQMRVYKQWVNPKVLNRDAYQKTLNKERRKNSNFVNCSSNDAEYNRTIEMTRKYIESLNENK